MMSLLEKDHSEKFATPLLFEIMSDVQPPGPPERPNDNRQTRSSIMDAGHTVKVGVWKDMWWHGFNKCSEACWESKVSCRESANSISEVAQSGKGYARGISKELADKNIKLSVNDNDSSVADGWEALVNALKASAGELAGEDGVAKQLRDEVEALHEWRHKQSKTKRKIIKEGEDATDSLKVSEAACVAARERYKKACGKASKAILRRDSLHQKYISASAEKKTKAKSYYNTAKDTVQSRLSEVNNTCVTYKTSVADLKREQEVYKTTMMSVMEQFEDIEIRRLVYMQRFITLAASRLESHLLVSQRAIEDANPIIDAINAREDIKSFVDAHVAENVPSPLCEYIQIKSELIEKERILAREKPIVPSKSRTRGLKKKWKSLFGSKPKRPKGRRTLEQEYEDNGRATPTALKGAGKSSDPDFTLKNSKINNDNGFRDNNSDDTEELEESKDEPLQPPLQRCGSNVSNASFDVCCLAKVLFDFDADEEGELPLKVGQVIEVLDKEGDWWLGRLQGSLNEGEFPSNYVEVLHSEGKTSGNEVNSNSKKTIKAVALYDFDGSDEGDLAFSKGDILFVQDCGLEGWWQGSIEGSEVTGNVPQNYLKVQ